jgi:hypothetical protein
MVDGHFPEGTTPKSLVGQKVQYEYEHPYISIAMHVRTIGQNARGQRMAIAGDPVTVPVSRGSSSPEKKIKKNARGG